MAGVGGEHDPAASGQHAHALDAGGVAADAMDREPRCQLLVAVMEGDAASEEMAHHLDHILDGEGVAHRRMAHAPAGGKRHLAVLDVEARPREGVERPGMVVMQMGDDDVLDPRGIDAQRLDPRRRRPQQLAAAQPRLRLAEAGIDDEDAVRALRHPDEIVERRSPLMRVAADEVLRRAALGKMRVADGEKVEGLDRGAHALARAPCGGPAKFGITSAAKSSSEASALSMPYHGG